MARIGKKKKNRAFIFRYINKKNLITDVLIDRDYHVIDLFGIRDISELDLDLVIYYHIPTKKLPGSYMEIFKLSIPILLISPFNYFIPNKNIKGFLKSPFNIKDFYIEVDRLVNNES